MNTPHLAGSTVLLFPGQGLHYVGMGRALAAESAAARAVFAAADDALGYTLSRLAWEGPEAELVRTCHAQPAILATSLAAFAVLRERGDVTIGALAGHSLGEWSALVAAEVLAFRDAIRLVHLRGRAMEEAVAPGVGGMLAVHGLGRGEVVALCAEVSDHEGSAAVATHNGPASFVVAGHLTALARVSQLAVSRGASGTAEVPVVTPFHSPLMAPAAERLAAALADVPVGIPRWPIRSTIVDGWLDGASPIKELLVQQVTAPVLWLEAVTALVAAGATSAVALEPGKALPNMVRRISRRLTVALEGQPAER